MKITKRQLRQIIKEELNRDILSELGFLANLGIAGAKKLATKGAQKALVNAPKVVQGIRGVDKALKTGGTGMNVDKVIDAATDKGWMTDEEKEDAAAELALDAAGWSWNIPVALASMVGKAAYEPTQQYAKELGTDTAETRSGTTGVTRKSDVDKYLHPYDPTKGGSYTSVEKARDQHTGGFKASDLLSFLDFGEFEEASMSEGRVRLTELQLKRIIREEKARILKERRVLRYRQILRHR